MLYAIIIAICCNALHSVIADTISPYPIAHLYVSSSSRARIYRPMNLDYEYKRTQTPYSHETNSSWNAMQKRFGSGLTN